MTPNSSFFYANALELGASPYDLNLKFVRNGLSPGQAAVISSTPTEVKPVELESINVCMSPSHFKAMLPALITAVVNYEKAFGEIPLQPQIKAQWTAMMSKP